MTVKLTINACAGGEESKDWVAMLSRMYEKWGKSHHFDMKVSKRSDGSATVEFIGIDPYN